MGIMNNFKLGVLCSFGMGGADRCNLNILRALKNMGIGFKLFYTDASIPYRVEGFHPPGYIPPSRFSQFSELAEPIYIKNASEINSHDITILHTHRSGEDINLIPSLQSSKNSFKILESNFYGQTMTRADHRIYVSHEIARGRGSVIPNAISPPETDSDMRSSLGIADKFVFGKISRPDNDIYSSISLEAYKMVEDSTTIFLYVGTNPKAIEKASSLGINNIIFMDPILDLTELSRAYNSIDLFCHSNGCGETFGNSVAEAFMHGKPVISHKGGADNWHHAHKSLFGTRIDLYVEDRSVSKYADLMLKMKDDTKFRHEASAYLTNRANELYHSDVVAKQYLDIYRSL